VENDLKLSNNMLLLLLASKLILIALEISMKLFNIFTTFNCRSELIHCVDINLCHSDLFPSQTELKVIGYHHTYVRLKVIGHFVRRPCKIYFKAWGNVVRKQCFLVCPPSGNVARKQCFLVCPPLGNIARKQGFLVCPPSGNLAKGNNVSWFAYLRET
jgi:metallophosphoesterase superfamily enzyme